MHRNASSQLVARWMHEPKFRDQIRADCETAVQQAGIQLNEAEWQGLRRIGWSLTHWVNFLMLVDVALKSGQH